MAYTRMMGTAGVLEMDKVEVNLPCDDSLFDAPTTLGFLQASEGSPTIMPRMHSSMICTILQSKLNRPSVQTILNVTYLQCAAARHRLLVGNIILPNDYSFAPVEAFMKDVKAKDIVLQLLILAPSGDELVRSKNISTTVAWNGLCILLTADLNLLETACGREGVDSARAALSGLTKWSRTASARRAILHAAQTYYLLSTYKTPETYISRPDYLLFLSALVLSLYLYVCPDEQIDDLPRCELLQEMDWSVVEGEGLSILNDNTNVNPTTGIQPKPEVFSAARNFIKSGGPISFAGEAYRQGDISARKLLLDFACLLERFEKRNSSKYSRLLRSMSKLMSAKQPNMHT